jgi:hypothetical protein
MAASTAGGPGGGMPPDSTNAGTPGASTTLSGESLRGYALKRLRQQQQSQGALQSSKVTGPPNPSTIRRM